MRTGPLPETLFDAAALVGGLSPRPVFDTLLAAGLARTLMVASRVGLFEALADGPRTAAEVAAQCDTHPAATDKLLGALAGAGYLTLKRERYGLARVARRWLLREAPLSVHDHMELMFVVWRWLEHYETFLRTGEPLDVHGDLDEAEWGLYQRGMRALAGLLAPEMAWRTPVPKGARDLLDIGGSHGFYSVALCRRHRQLRATVFDLPEAIDHGRAAIAAEEMADRIGTRAGDAREADFGEACLDVVLVAQLMHHFDPDENRDLLRRIARALRPGGVVVVQEVIRPQSPTEAGQSGALGDLYFAALSEAGTYGYEEIAGWQRDAGLSPLSPLSFVTFPGVGQQSARKG